MPSDVVLLLKIIVLSACLTQVNAQFHSCQNDTFYAPNTTFRINIDAVLSHLISNATSTSGFYSATVGSGKYAVNGLFFCRGDVTPTKCRDCVADSSDRARLNCAGSRAADIYADNCTLRYSNETIVSKLSLEPSFTLWNPQKSSDPERFNELWNTTMVELKEEIVNGTVDFGYGDKKWFGTKAAVFTPLQTMTNLAQCSPSLSASDCDLCLTTSIAQLPSCCFGQRGGRVMRPSCYIRSEVYAFYSDPTGRVTSPNPFSFPEPDVPSRVPETDSGNDGVSTRVIVAISVPVCVGTILAFVAVWCCRQRRKKSTDGKENSLGESIEAESLQFSFETIQAATNCFSQEKKLGGGGFGDVYLGLLPNGIQIVAKRLPNCSRQNARAFENEVLLVSKLQHRNIAKLMGFCSEGQERILIYEFVSNKSLDHFLSDPEKQKLLDWPKRYTIIYGIARGLLYLHEDSPLKIIHRDLKASNVLLDQNMNPQIADFGTARIVHVDESGVNTKTIFGTHGYMPPEYAMHGHYSVKSDVYSFGVLVLEIITGRKNESFCQSDEISDILSYAWKGWTKGNPLELLDSCIGEKYSRNEVLKCIHIALLCVQDDLSYRPTMQTIMLMLNSSSVSMPRPHQPTHYAKTGLVGEI